MSPNSNAWGAIRSIAVRSKRPARSQQPTITAIARQITTGPRLVLRPGSIPKLQSVEGGTIPGFSEEPDEQGALQLSDVIKEARMRQRQLAQAQLELTTNGLNPFDKRFTGLKFDEPEMPQGKLHETKFHLRFRYEEGITQLTNLLMRDGKLSKAQRDMAMVLNYLRTSSPPKINPQRPLLPGSPPAEQLPLNPELYLMLAIDTVAPLIRIRGFTGLAGGGKALEVPVPISRRARRRAAFNWIMDVVKKKPSMGSGKKMLAHRIGEEIVAVIEGRSSVWERRTQLHKLGTSVRANLSSPALMKRRVV